MENMQRQSLDEQYYGQLCGYMNQSEREKLAMENLRGPSLDGPIDNDKADGDVWLCGKDQ